LEKFYEEEGRSQTSRLFIPIGSHQLCVDSRVITEDKDAAIAPASDRQTSSLPYLARALAGTCTVLAVACALLGLKLTELQRRVEHFITPVSVPRFWSTFYGNGLATEIVLPTPVFFAYGPASDGSTIMVRDTNLNEYNQLSDSATLRSFEKLLQGPQLAQNYTVTSDTFAAVRLVRHLDRFKFPTTVHSSADAVMETLDTQNVIALGTWGTLSPFTAYLDRMNFKLAMHEDSVDNRSPRPGEPKRISEVQESVDRAIWPGIVAVLPGPNAHSHLLIIAGRHTSALVSFLTSTDGLGQLDRLWRQSGSPNFYEVVVNAEVDGTNTTPVRFWPVALHNVGKQ
jgi:hypothetical protein